MRNPDRISSKTAALGMIESQPQLVPYDERWPALYQALAGQLGAVLEDRVHSIHHVGSTSVPGLSAKPVLDILIGVQDLPESYACIPALADLGFEFGPEDDIAERLYFRGRRNGLRTHHISIAEETSAQFINALVFRDALRSSPELAREYEALKIQLFQPRRRGLDPHLGKTEFVRGVLRSNGGVVNA